jgi:photosystem II stability/assembly factor-like uncharacterized protein
MKKILLVFFTSILFLLQPNIFAQIDRLDYYDFGIRQRHEAYPSKSPWINVPDDIKNTNFFRRVDWFYLPRLNESGVFPKKFIDQQRAIEIAKANLQNETKNTSDQWTNIGPVGVDMSETEVPHWGNISGRIRGLAIHPSNPDIVYIGAASGGIWKTIDGGQTWTDKSSDLNILTFGSIAIDPVNPDIIYAGTGESAWYIFYNMYSGDGLYKSVDAGEHWTKIGSELGSVTHFSDIAVSPHDPNVLMAALATSYQFPSPNQGIWRSSDAGVSWTHVVDITGAFDLAFNPTNPNLVYAATGNKQQTGGFLISNDGGVSFNQSNTGLPPYTSMGRLQFDVSQSDPSVLYCLVHDFFPVAEGMCTCAYKSTNGGESWFQISPGVNIAGSYDGMNAFDQGDYDLCISVNPSNPDIVFIGNVELSTTTDGSSVSFVRKPDGPSGGLTALDSYLHLDVHNIQFAPSNPSIVYVGCDGGIYKSTDSGQSFMDFNNGINSIQLYTVASHPTDPDILYGGAQDNGGFSTKNRGVTSWVDKVTGDGMKCFVDYSNPDIVFIGTVFGNLSRSNDGGSNWFEIVPAMMDSTAFRSIYWQNPVNPNFIYGAIKHRIYKSTDKGNTWFFTTTSPVTNVEISAVAQSKISPGNMMLITRDIPASIYRSLDEGFTWTDITANINFEDASLMNIKADPIDGQTFYLLRGSYTNGQVLKTIDFGNIWTDISSDLPKVPASDIFVDPENEGTMFLGNDFGVYSSTNNGVNWSKLKNGFPFVPVIEFSYFNFDGTRLLRAATYGRGVFELVLEGFTSVNEIVSNSDAIRSWPNPASDLLWIDLPEIAEDKYVLSLITINGQEVESKTVFTSGTKCRTSIDISQLKPGIYQLVFKSDRLLNTNKVMIVR